VTLTADYIDLVLVLIAFLAGAAALHAVQCLRAFDPRVNLRAQVIASVRLSAAHREIVRLREQLDMAWTVADQRLDFLRDVASALGADTTEIEDDLDPDALLAAASRLRAQRLRDKTYDPAG
jgi:hypothetical protein